MFFTSLIVAGVVALAITLAMFIFIPNRYIRSRLQFSVWLLLAFLVLEVAITQGVGDLELFAALARLVFVLAVINLLITLLANRWREQRASDRYPAILQDVTLIGAFTIVATVLLKEQLLTTSAVGAVVVGFALQDTLGNLFSGLAIQIEKPFRVGHWIAVGEREGQVQEITWRATKLRTKAGQFLVVPNGIISKEAILNYSEPTIPTRLLVEVGASYSTPPNETKAAIVEALANCPLVLSTPPPTVLLHDFAASALTYRIWFWVGDYAVELEARDQVRTNIWYTFRRRNIEIPYPIQIEYSREELPLRAEADVTGAATRLAAIDLFATLPADARLALSRNGQEHIFADGEAIVREGTPGSSLYVVLNGRARVALDASGREVATIEPGGFFGEMSMLTGEPRTATVRAVGDVRALEIPAERFRELAIAQPGLVEHITIIVAARRSELDDARAAAATSTQTVTAPRSLFHRIQQFLKLP
ncbi:MAG TPA: mechanosensitive ion channel family protein [Vicinamibacterales bacterium]|nr:mechanosensitive ion channel family protein [Vicinamibacterales bacterium]